jgi:protein-tyrosine phosphatase
MNILYNCYSLLRILPLKGIEFVTNCIAGNNAIKTYRLINTSNSTKISNHITNIFLEPTHIIDNIYLGNAYNSSNYSVIKNNNIKYIINVTKELPNYYEKNDINYYRIPISDNCEHHISIYIQDAMKFIEQTQSNNNGNILIHCYMGSSRSASIILAYLVYKYKYDIDKAIDFIKNKRNIVNINLNFIDDVRNYFNNDVHNYIINDNYN